MAITQQPTDVIVSAGKPYTFALKLDGTPPWTIQWQIKRVSDADFQNVSGGTGANDWNYTAIANYLTDNNALFRCIVSNGGDPVISDEVLLTVLPVPLLQNVIWTGLDTDPYLYLVFNLPVDASGITTENYTLTGAVSGPDAVVAADFDNTYAVNGDGSSVRLTLLSPLNYTEKFTLRASDIYDAIDGANIIDPNPSLWTLDATPRTNSVRREWFTGITGTAIDANLFTVAAYTNNAPNTVDYLAAINSPSVADNYGLRLTGWLVPRIDGPYRFHIYSDDEGRFLLSTSADAAGLRRVAGYPAGACCNQGVEDGINGMSSTNTVYGIGPDVVLTAGQPYYFEAFVKEGTGGDSLTVTWKPPSATGFTNIPGTNLFFGVQPAQQLNFPASPADQAVIEYGSAVFSAQIAASEPNTIYQWYSNDVAIAGASGVLPGLANGGVRMVSYTIPVVTPGMSGVFHCTAASQVKVGALMGSIFPGAAALLQAASGPAALTVNSDPVGPAIASVGSLDGTGVGVAFDKYVDPASATALPNYTINGEAIVTSATIAQANPTKVWLTLFTPAPDGSTVTATVRSGAGVENTSSATVVLENLTSRDMGFVNNPIPGRTYTFAPGEADLYGGGADIWGGEVRAQVALREITGNFDVKVRLQSLGYTSGGGGWSKAGLMAHDGTHPSGMTITLHASPPSPGQNVFQSYWNPVPVGATDWGTRCGANQGGNSPACVYPNQYMPNAWMRMTRQGAVFTSYVGNDGTTWLLHTLYTNTAAPDTLLVGLCDTAHENVNLVKAEFRNLYMPATLPYNLVVTPPAAPACGSPADFTVTAENPPDSGPLWYQWKKNNVNIPGATSATLTVDFSDPTAVGAAYSVLVGNDGGGVLSAPAQAGLLGVAAVSPGANGVYVSFSVPVDVTSAQNIANYTFAGPGISTPPNAVSATLVSPKVVYVTALDVLNPFLSYTLSIAGVQDVALTPICPNPATLPFTGVGQGYIFADFTGNVIPPYAQLYYNGSPVGADATGGGGIVQDDVLKLTLAASNSRGAILFNDQNCGQPILGFNASFKVAAFGLTSPPADGWSFNFAPNLADVPRADAEQGVGTGFSVCCIVYPNNTPSFRLRWNGVQFAQYNLQTWQNVGQPPIPFKNVTMALTPAGKFTMTYDGTIIFDNLQTPATPLAGQFGLYARCGASNANMWFDDIQISTVLEPGPLALMLAPTEPADVALTEGQSVQLYAPFSGSPCHFGQWYSNGVAIAGANNPVYSQRLTYAGTGGTVTYRFQVANVYNTIVTRDILVTVNPDTVRPTMTVAIGTTPTTVRVTFSEPMGYLGTSLGLANWGVFSGVTPVATVIGVAQPAANQALLTLDTPLAVGAVYRLEAYANGTTLGPPADFTGVVDAAGQPIGPDGGVPGASGSIEFGAYQSYTGAGLNSGILPTAGVLPLGTLAERGFDARAVRAQVLPPYDFNSTTNTELVLAEATAWQGRNTAKWACFIEPGIINYNHNNEALPNGYGRIVGPAQPDKAFPGYLRSDLIDYAAMEFVAYVALQPGAYRWGVNSDDGFRVLGLDGAAAFGSQSGVVLGEFSGGRGTTDTLFDFIAPQAGLYPMRLTYEQGTGGANVELWSLDVASATYTAINAETGILAYRAPLLTVAEPAAPQLAVAKQVGGAYNGAVLGAGLLAGEYAFLNESTGYATPDYTLSQVNLGSFLATDSLQVELLATWDANTVGALPNWEIVSGSVLTPTVSLPIDFMSSDGGFTVANSTPAPTGPWTYTDGTGWSANGEPGLTPNYPTWSALRSPALPVGADGSVGINLLHRWSFQTGAFDAGQIRISVNGGPFTPVPVSSFTGDLLPAGGFVVSWNGALPCMQNWVLQGKTDLGAAGGWTNIGFIKAGANSSYIVPPGLPFQFFRVVSENHIATP